MFNAFKSSAETIVDMRIFSGRCNCLKMKLLDTEGKHESGNEIEEILSVYIQI